jgi:CDGSH-type Zn-finger protein
MAENKGKIVVTKNGPYMVSGDLPLAIEIQHVDNDGNPGTWEKGKIIPAEECYALCRCGKSSDKPFCDGAHEKAKFNGRETASREPYLKQARVLNGPTLKLTDAQDFCAASRFCHKGTWQHTQKSDNPESRKIAIETACNCSSGRLVIWDKKTGKPIEHKFEPSIGIIQDKDAGVSGPIWVKGGIPIESADGTQYEVRNRVTLCRCGHSGNKPYCDGSHIPAKFNDGDKSLKKQ